MIRLLCKGRYQTYSNGKKDGILIFDNDIAYSWTKLESDGDILKPVKLDSSKNTLLASGPYRLFEVEDEPGLTSFQHLELFIGDGKWQGYLLPTGLPASGSQGNRIFLTTEIITTCMKHKLDFINQRGLY